MSENMEQEGRGHTVIIGATGIVDKNIKKYVGRIPGCHNIYSLQRSAILGTAHILRKVLSIKPD